MTKWLCLLAIVLLTVAPAVAATPDEFKQAVNDSVSKHYDPAHLGHWHQCARCGAKYHQQGDSGPYSPGSYICPSCGNANPVPNPQPNPYPPQPQPPYYPPQPNPYPPQPQPPYYPPQPQPGYMTAQDFINLAHRASSYSEGDRILVDGAARLNDAAGILSLATECYNQDNARRVLQSLNRAGLVNPPSYDLFERYAKKASSYALADAILAYSVNFVYSANQLFYLGTRFYNNDSGRQFVEAVDRNFGRLSDPPTLVAMRKYVGACSSYSLSDLLLVAAVRYFTSYQDIVKLSEMAYNSDTRNRIMNYASQYGAPYQPSYPPPYNPAPGGYQPSYPAPVTPTPGGYPHHGHHPRAAAKLDLGTDAGLAVDDASGIGLDKADLKVENLSKIEGFLARHKAGQVKKSPLADETVKAVRDFLRTEYLKGNAPELQRMVDELER